MAGTAEGDEGVEELRQTLLPGALAGEAGGEVGFGERDAGFGEDAGDGGDLLGQGIWPGVALWLGAGRRWGCPALLSGLRMRRAGQPYLRLDRLRLLGMLESGAQPAHLAGRLTGIDFDWQKAGNEKHKNWSNTVMGKIAIDGGRLTAEVNSENRALLFRSLMDARLPGARYRTMSIQSIESMLNEKQGRAPTAAERQAEAERAAFNAQPEVQALLAEELRRHYREWPDMKLPGLGNKTPRQAVKNRDGRELVEGILLKMARDAENLPGFDPAIVQELRLALGLTQKPLL